MRILLIRHGATEWSRTGQHTGLTDIPLLDEGRDQAAVVKRAVPLILGDALGDIPVWCSPLQRARETAEIIFGPDTPVSADDLLECDYGRYEGLTPQRIREISPGWDIWSDGCPDGESIADVGARADRFLGRLPGGDATVAVVAHGHVLRVLAARSIHLEPERGQVFTLDTATISLIEDVRGKRVVRLWNIDPALVVGDRA